MKYNCIHSDTCQCDPCCPGSQCVICTGPTGATGPQGPVGPTGPTGPQGATGEAPSMSLIQAEDDGLNRTYNIGESIAFIKNTIVAGTAITHDVAGEPTQFVIQEDGYYKLSCKCLYRSDTAGTANLTFRVNTMYNYAWDQIAIVPGEFTRKYMSYYNEVLIKCAAGSDIDLQFDMFGSTLSSIIIGRPVMEIQKLELDENNGPVTFSEPMYRER